MVLPFKEIDILQLQAAKYFSQDQDAKIAAVDHKASGEEGYGGADLAGALCDVDVEVSDFSLGSF